MAATACSSAPTAYGYSRRCPPGDAKTTDRRRLLTDRNAYISFLEAQAERHDHVEDEVHTLDSCVRQLGTRVDELEERVRSFRNIEETVHGALRAATVAQENAIRAGDDACVGCRELQDELRSTDGRLQSLSQVFKDTHTAMEAEMARTRNEVAFQVQDLGHRLDERMHRLQSIADEGASSVIREAQKTCVRLADDALGAAEASQRKVDEHQRWTEARLEVLRLDFTSLRAELAGRQKSGEIGAAHTGTEPEAAFAPSVYPFNAEGIDALANEMEARLAGRLGQQVLQLSEVLRRVVQTQATLSQQWSASGGAAVSAPTQPPLPAISVENVANGGPAIPGDNHRRVAIDELYQELRHMERIDAQRKSAHCRGHGAASARA